MESHFWQFRHLCVLRIRFSLNQRARLSIGAQVLCINGENVVRFNEPTNVKGATGRYVEGLPGGHARQGDSHGRLHPRSDQGAGNGHEGQEPARAYVVKARCR